MKYPGEGPAAQKRGGYGARNLSFRPPTDDGNSSYSPMGRHLWMRLLP